MITVFRQAISRPHPSWSLSFFRREIDVRTRTRTISQVIPSAITPVRPDYHGAEFAHSKKQEGQDGRKERETSNEVLDHLHHGHIHLSVLDTFVDGKCLGLWLPHRCHIFPNRR